MDLIRMYFRIADQEELRRRIQSFDPAINSLQRTCARQLDPGHAFEASDLPPTNGGMVLRKSRPQFFSYRAPVIS